MAKVATKKTIKTKSYEFFIEKKDVIEQVDFGTFEVVKTKKGILFRNYTGYHVWTTPYTVGLDGTARSYSLYAWLEELIEFKKAIEGHEDEIYEGTDMTNADILESHIVVTVANMNIPMTIFIDPQLAYEQAEKYIKWLTEKQQELSETIAAGAPEENLAVDAEEAVKAEIGEQVVDALKEIVEGGK